MLEDALHLDDRFRSLIPDFPLMPYQTIQGIPVFGDPQQNAVDQIVRCARTADHAALMADHHLGYAVPIGGVVAYRGRVSPSGVGYDIACGNKAVRLDVTADEVRKDISTIMNDIFGTLSFGVGRKNDEPVDHVLFDDDPAWQLPVAASLKSLAREQLGTIGSGNHYVDLFVDEDDHVWAGVHFGSRGLGHRIATHFIRAGGGKDGIDVDPVVLDADGTLGADYVACMKLAGRYAYAGRDWVCDRVAKLLGASIEEEVHNHHNFAWEEEHQGERLWVVRKGATPAFPGQRGFVGGSMGDVSVILEGVQTSDSSTALYSTVHGAGRVMSRTRAAGKARWRGGRKVRQSEGAISREMMMEWVRNAGVELRGAGTDESPHVYKRLPDVIAAHEPTIRVLHTLKPIGVAMAGEDEYDPFRD
jgi:tRNA-splicing ligase RtcB (3'-phosphate/5'-hydroxy nucleic acid ligase)